MYFFPKLTYKYINPINIENILKNYVFRKKFFNIYIKI